MKHQKLARVKVISGANLTRAIMIPIPRYRTRALDIISNLEFTQQGLELLMIRANETSTATRSIRAWQREVMECQEGEFEYGENASWTIASSSGLQQAVFVPKRWWTVPTGEVMILAELSLTGQFLERDRPERGEFVEDFRLEVRQIVIARSRVEILLAELNQWFEQPREIAVELSAAHHVSLRIAFEADPRLICKASRPACSVRYSTGTSVTFECLSVTDQSCLRLLRDDLARFLT